MLCPNAPCHPRPESMLISHIPQDSYTVPVDGVPFRRETPACPHPVTCDQARKGPPAGRRGRTPRAGAVLRQQVRERRATARLRGGRRGLRRLGHPFWRLRAALRGGWAVI